jgi:hypothetical protein
MASLMHHYSYFPVAAGAGKIHVLPTEHKASISQASSRRRQVAKVSTPHQWARLASNLGR